MINLSVAIHQPNFFPWIGYFHKIAQCDTFIFLDDVQFPRGNRGCVVNRVGVLYNEKQIWLTLPLVKHKSDTPILDIQFLGEEKKELLKKILHYYTRAPFFNETMRIVEECFDNTITNLADFNIHSIQCLAKYVGLKRSFIKSSELNIKSAKQDKIIDLVKKINGAVYISGQGAKKYQTQDHFVSNNIELIYQNFNEDMSDYFPNFIPDYAKLSILHLLFLYGISKTSEVLKKI